MASDCVVEEQGHEWVWDKNSITSSTVLSKQNQEVCFHPVYSSGTAAVRGDTPCVAGRDYYWEIEMLTPIYGTDVMIGVGTKKVDLGKFKLNFISLLGSDEESWGYSYTGMLHHNGVLKKYGIGFTQGSIVGIHLDMWRGILTYFLNRKPVGVAFTCLNSHVLYPMVCSTAARSAMRIVCSHSQPSSLQLTCLKALDSGPAMLHKLHSIPGLRIQARSAFWLLLASPGTSSEGTETHNFANEDGESDEDIETHYRRLVSSFRSASGKCEREFFRPASKRPHSKRHSSSLGDVAVAGPGQGQQQQLCPHQDAQSTSQQGVKHVKRLCLLCDLIL